LVYFEKYLPFIVILEEGEMGQGVYQFEEGKLYEIHLEKRMLGVAPTKPSKLIPYFRK
jgi:hypothetical protein